MGKNHKTSQHNEHKTCTELHLEQSPRLKHLLKIEEVLKKAATVGKKRTDKDMWKRFQMQNNLKVQNKKFLQRNEKLASVKQHDKIEKDHKGNFVNLKINK